MAVVDQSISASQSGSRSGHARRHDLDWLRVIAFGLLIFYHIGMFYVTWGWHVKSVYAGPAAEPVMLLVNPWRLALLFFISGVAIRFASDKAPRRADFAKSRAFRLGLPILAGMLVVVAPQSYFELRQAGAIEPGYLSFWGDYLNLEQMFSMITPTWNHLWYVVYLLVYILLVTPFLPFLRRLSERHGEQVAGALLGGPVRLLFITILPFVFYELFLSPRFPTTHDLFNDWANHTHRFTVFLLGYFAAKNARFWASVEKAWPWALALVVLIGGFRLYLRAFHWKAYTSLFEGATAPAMAATLTLYAWSSIVALLGLGQRFLNRPSALLTYLTGAVFCYYILHQTIIVVVGYYLTSAGVGAWPEFLILVAATLAACALGYEAFRRAPVVSVFFGIKRRPSAQA